MHNCAHCEVEIPDGETRNVGPTLYDENNKRVTNYLCPECNRDYGDNRLKWCPHEDCETYFTTPNEDWASPFTLVSACPTHSTATTAARLPCRGCGRSTGEMYISLRGRVYCMGCWDVGYNCSAGGCGNRFPLADTAVFTKHGEGVTTFYTCKDCPPVKFPRWFPGHWGHVSRWEYSPTCKCRMCEHLSREAPDLYPTVTVARDDRKLCSYCDYTAAEGTEAGGRWYCHACATTQLRECSDCDTPSAPHTLMAIGGKVVCTPCLRGGAYWFCGVGCHSWYPNGADCRCGGVFPWNYTPEGGFQFFIGSGERFDDNFHPYLGFELEVEAIGDGTSRTKGANLVRSLIGNEWSYLVHDGSLLERGQRGFEIVTHPFTMGWLNENWSSIETLLTTLSSQGYRSWESGRCGMHVHISRGPMTDAHQMKFLRFIYGSTNLALSIGQRSYRSRGVREYAPFDRERRDMFMDKIRGQTNPGGDGHRAAVNTNKAATLEGRWFRGTLNPEGFRKNIEFMHSVWYFTRKFGFASANEMNYIEWLRSKPESRIYSTLLDYIERNYITRR